MRTDGSKEPLLSFAIPVRNGADHIRRLLDCVLAQNVQRLEVVISDNCSTDGTAEIVQEYASRDSRIRYSRNSEDIGQVENFNRAFSLTSGKYVRLIGVDDWLEPQYARTCLSLLETNVSLGAVTTDTVLHHEDDKRAYCFQYRGERLESPHPERRFARMLWLLAKGQSYCCPISAVFRREILAKTPPFRVVPHMDLVMAAEISLLAPFGHVAEPLVHRTRPASPPSKRADYWKRYYPRDPEKVRGSIWKACRTINTIVWQAAPLTRRQKLACTAAIFRYCFERGPIHARQALKLKVVLALPEGSWLRKKLDSARCGRTEKRGVVVDSPYAT